MERANQVLAERMVHTNLAADGAVDLRQERGRNLHQRDPAQKRRRRKARRIAQHPAAERDDRAAAIGSGSDERFVYARHRGQRLVSLAIGQQDWITGAERLLHLRTVQSPDVRARHDEPARADAMRVEQHGKPIGGALADPDRREARADGDINPDRLVLYVGAHKWSCPLN
jgi:hypothetical protein